MSLSLSRVPLRFAVPLFLTGPVIVVSIVLVSVAAVQGRANVRQLVAQSTMQLHGRIEEQIDALLGVPRQVTRMNAAAIASGDLAIDDLRSWADSLVHQAVGFESLSAVTWGDVAGHATWIARYAGHDGYLYAVKDDATAGQIVEYRVTASGISPERFNTYDFDLFSRPWYTTSIDAGRPAWSPPFVWAGGDPSDPPTVGIGFGRPVRDADGQLLGVIDAEFSLHDLSRYLADLTLVEGSLVAVLDGDGHLLANSGGLAVAANGRLLPAASVADGRLTALAADWAARRSEVLRHGTSDAVIRADGDHHWVQLSRFERDTGLSWVVATIVPEAVFLAPLRAARIRSMVIAVFGVLASVGLGLGLSRTVVRPIVALGGHVETIGRGRLDAEIELDQAPEFTTLSGALNTMTGDLNRLVGQVKRASIQLSSTATELAASSREQEAAVNSFGGSSNEIAAAVRQIAASGGELSGTMTDLNEVANSTATLATSGQAGLQRMEETITGLGSATRSIAEKLAVINDKAGDISSVVTTINKVADQTNLLSVNATIEAEKAGQYGAGFLVVAREVRRLADQTASATLDIERMVEHMQASVSSGVMEMDRFSDRVHQTVQDVKAISGQMGQILEQVQSTSSRFETALASVQDQARGTDQISDSVSQLSEVACRTIETSHEFAQAARDLHTAIAALQSSIAPFRLRE